MFKMYADENGLPYSDYGTYRGLEIGVQRSVLSVAERGLWCWNNFELGNDNVLLSYDWSRWPDNKESEPKTTECALALMKRCADWMVNEISSGKTFSVWKYAYQMSYETGPGWRSAHAQALGMQLLTRMKMLTGDVTYTSELPKLLKAFETPVSEGGLMDHTYDGIVWFEKFADTRNKKPKVLNGMMFAVLGLYDIAKHSEDSHLQNNAKALAEVGTDSILELLPRFDLGKWSAYDILSKKASRHYHEIHIEQLHRLFRVTLDQSFLGWSDRFSRYLQLSDEHETLKKTVRWNSIHPVGSQYHGIVANNYLSERVQQPIWRLENKAVRRFLGLVPDHSKVIDVPFGTGRFYNIYFERKMQVTGVDTSQDMLEIANDAYKKHDARLETVQACAENLPFEDGSFDVAICVRFLETIIPFRLVTLVLMELRRVTHSYAIVRLNTRESSLDPLDYPQPNERLGVSLNLTQIGELCMKCGWQLRDNDIVGHKHPQKRAGEQRICLLKAV
jgi:SAM-dependent methyltransferase